MKTIVEYLINNHITSSKSTLSKLIDFFDKLAIGELKDGLQAKKTKEYAKGEIHNTVEKMYELNKDDWYDGKVRTEVSNYLKDLSTEHNLTINVKDGIKDSITYLLYDNIGICSISVNFNNCTSQTYAIYYVDVVINDKFYEKSQN